MNKTTLLISSMATGIILGGLAAGAAASPLLSAHAQYDYGTVSDSTDTNPATVAYDNEDMTVSGLANAAATATAGTAATAVFHDYRGNDEAAGIDNGDGSPGGNDNSGAGDQGSGSGSSGNSGAGSQGNDSENSGNSDSGSQGSGILGPPPVPAPAVANAFDFSSTATWSATYTATASGPYTWQGYVPSAELMVGFDDEPTDIAAQFSSLVSLNGATLATFEATVDFDHGLVRSADMPDPSSSLVTGDTLDYSWDGFSFTLDLGNFNVGDTFTIGLNSTARVWGSGVNNQGLAEIGDPGNLNTPGNGMHGNLRSPSPPSPGPAPVPEPTTLLLFGSGIMGVTAILRKKTRKDKEATTS